MLQLLLDSQQKNPFFRAPIGEKACHILDVGCGDGTWAIDVADQFPNLIVHGVDLYPPPNTWVPPNCILEVDDITQPWTWSHKFDLVHCRGLYGCFTKEASDNFYRTAFEFASPFVCQ